MRILDLNPLIQILKVFSINIFAMYNSEEVKCMFIKCIYETVNMLHTGSPYIFITVQFFNINGRIEDIFSEKLNNLPTSLLDIIR